MAAFFVIFKFLKAFPRQINYFHKLILFIFQQAFKQKKPFENPSSNGKNPFKGALRCRPRSLAPAVSQQPCAKVTAKIGPIFPLSFAMVHCFLVLSPSVGRAFGAIARICGFGFADSPDSSLVDGISKLVVGKLHQHLFLGVKRLLAITISYRLFFLSIDYFLID